MASKRDQKVILAKELLVLRVTRHDNQHDINPYYLLALLSSKYVYEQCSYMSFFETTYPQIGDRWKDSVLPVHKKYMDRKSVARRVEKAIKSKWDSQYQIDKLRQEMGEIIT